jgi:hypothetical protein
MMRSHGTVETMKRRSDGWQSWAPTATDIAASSGNEHHRSALAADFRNEAVSRMSSMRALVCISRLKGWERLRKVIGRSAI